LTHAFDFYSVRIANRLCRVKWSRDQWRHNAECILQAMWLLL